jgi:hypothetical protein
MSNTTLPDKTISVEVSDDEDETFEVAYEPRCVWLICSKRSIPMPIGNMIYPYRRAEILGREGKLLTLKLSMS